ncbi:AmmeMemoRadiSam system radical SAM enzyme [Candidatus Poribacteria bacterium]|nr:AmmeMemoRadiSam system radical SAM enzyme [Candidatus Poribacteria bacterium]
MKFEDKINRRQFIKKTITTAGLFIGANALFAPISSSAPLTTIYRKKSDPSKKIEALPRKLEVTLTEGKYYRTTGPYIQCTLCPLFCVIPEGEAGICRVRINQGRKLYTMVYGQPCSVAFHPMEQGPIFHAFPGSRCIGLATAGCNLRCKYCQNWQMSQFDSEETDNYDLPPERVAILAREKRCHAVVFAYTEPVVSYEYTMDTALKAKESGLKTVLVTAGYVDTQPLKDLCECMDVVRIDLKSFSEKFYEDVVGGKLKPVLDAIKVTHDQDTWLEIVDPIVSGYNDSPEEIEQMSKWMVENIGPDVPMHFLKFFPAYKMRNFPPTPEETLDRCRKIAMDAGLNYVYLGNMPGNAGENTFCPNCEKLLIARVGYLGITEKNIADNKCKFCGHYIPGLWESPEVG